MVRQDKIDRELAEAGWEPDGTFSEHLAIGESGDLCILVHRTLGRAVSLLTNSTMRGDTSPTGSIRSLHPSGLPCC
jgi:hypothetical protein